MVNRQMEKLSLVFKKKPLLAVWLFGSRAEGNVGPRSDFDFAFIAPDLDKDKRFTLRLELMDALMRELKTEKVDVINLEEATPYLAFEVVNKGKLLYSKDEPQTRYLEHRYRMNFLDWKWHHDRYIKDILQ